jgi:hypothetical protein
MKINSSTIGIEKTSSEYNDLENIVFKIAAVNGVKDVEAVDIRISAERGTLEFRTVEGGQAQTAPSSGTTVQPQPLGQNSGAVTLPNTQVEDKTQPGVYAPKNDGISPLDQKSSMVTDGRQRRSDVYQDPALSMMTPEQQEAYLAKQRVDAQEPSITEQEAQKSVEPGYYAPRDGGSYAPPAKQPIKNWKDVVPRVDSVRKRQNQENTITIKESVMKINSSTVSIDKTSAEYQALEGIIFKIAAQNGIKDVESVHVSLSEEQGIVGYKVAEVDFSQAHIQETTTGEKVEGKEAPMEESGNSASETPTDPVEGTKVDPQKQS